MTEQKEQITNTFSLGHRIPLTNAVENQLISETVASYLAIVTTFFLFLISNPNTLPEMELCTTVEYVLWNFSAPL